MKKIFYDFETTGIDWKINAPHQLTMLIEIDGQERDLIDYKIKPFESAIISAEALQIANVTEEQIKDYPTESTVYKNLIQTLSKNCNQFEKTDKYHLIGYNNRGFDDNFLRELWNRQRDKYFGSWFWADTIDVMVLASWYLSSERHLMNNFKQSTVAEKLGIEVDQEQLHDARYDIQLTKAIYDKITQSTINKN